MRLATRSTQNTIDLAILSLAYWAAFLLRFDGQIPLQMWKRLVFTWPYILTFEFAVLSAYAVPRFSWRHFGLKETVRIAWATGTIAGVLLVVRLLAAVGQTRWDFTQYALVPIGVIAANAAVSFLGISGIRALRRLSTEKESAQLLRSRQELVPTLMIGAGEAGAQVVRELEKRPDIGLMPVGFVDDDSAKQGTTVHGVRVWGGIDDLPLVAARLGARQAIITIADIEPPLMRRLLRLCEDAQIRAKVVPGLYKLIDGGLGLAPLRDVSIEDLLGRDAVQLDMGLVRSFLTGKHVVVTGAGGSIGSELCRQVSRFAPAALILVERNEFALFTIHQELTASHPNLNLVPRICDVGDLERLETVFGTDQPEVVFHAAAHKHVPMMESNPGEAIKNNVFGTKAVADAAARHRCEAFVFISTDKAVNPTSIMGATKRVAEMYVQSLSASSKTKFVAVRFGNVLGSTGSVIPTFKAQIVRGGPVTVTHPEMKRYFMTIPEASQLVMQAAAMGRGGEIFVLDMGQPVKIVDLATDLIRLSGFVPNQDIKIEFTGIRPGEKLFEELGFDAERMSRTAHPKIFIGRLAAIEKASIDASLSKLRDKIAATSAREVRVALRHVLPEMRMDCADEGALSGSGEISAMQSKAPATCQHLPEQKSG